MDRQKQLKKLLKEVFGYKDFRLEQSNIINSVLDGNDTMAIMPTGGGKSLCYQIPALFGDGLCVVISPLISLMKDQVINLKQNGVEGHFLNSSLSSDERREVERKLRRGEVKILYIAPEGILSQYILNLLSEVKLNLFAIDEAHCVSQWGHEFRKDYTKLSILKDTFPSVPILALTATADKRTREDMAHQLRLKNFNTYICSFDRPNIQYTICERENEIEQLDEFIQKFHKNDTGIVYCLSRKKVETITEKLKDLGYHAISYHAGLSSEERNRNQEIFSSADQVIVVATIAFGMGIDRPDVRFVAHLDLPKSLESYYQETGRAGRDGKEASAWMLYGLSDVVKLSRMLEMTEASEEYKQYARFKLDFMLSLCETTSCRRKMLLSYFDEHIDDCGNCDCCLEPQEMWDATKEAQMMLSCVYRTGQLYGSSYLIEVLRGSKNAKVLDRGHDTLSVYGIGKDVDKKVWDALLRQLLMTNYIAIKNFEYRTLALTSRSKELLRGEVSLKLRKKKEEGQVKIIQKILSGSAHTSHGREDLFEKLRGLRMDIAKEMKVPPYVIFNDKTLHDMCNIMPRSKDEMLMVNGVGQSKHEKYGDQFLKVIGEYI
ncbi:ATP-dependent DNA helicase RecQ [Bacteriovorax sp. BSW11_IV]|uniref:DNA helicase RecQ n=1 Tax=Bacteriovorax sp. BSW11_IV TaxID=1353529 RepID=UPI000389DB0E|nr:DNA helicase RecQ [Bacteriovorax sp. BSW11_IV]EQC42959.1 ATP-dependent DNA helicase RecQ [Bacteriovorax sp. BSW11_IV]